MPTPKNPKKSAETPSKTTAAKPPEESTKQRQAMQLLVDAIGRLRTVYLRNSPGSRDLSVEKEVEAALTAANELGIW